MNVPIISRFSTAGAVQEQPAPVIPHPTIGQPPQSPRPPRITRLQLVAVLAVVAVIAAFTAVVLTRDNGTEPAAQPAPAAFGTITSILPAGANSTLTDAVAGPDGNLYFGVRGATNSVAKMAPIGLLVYRPVPGTDLGPIAVGRDGTVFTSIVSDNATSIVRMAPGSESVQLFQVPSVDLGAVGKRTVFPIQAMTVASDGSLWFERGQLNRWDSVGGYTSAIGKLSAGGQMTVFPVADRLYSPGSMVEGPDGSMWFSATCVCARNGFLENTPASPAVDDTGKMVVKKYTVPTKADGATGIGPHPSRLVVVGGNLWFTEQQDDYATELTPAAPINSNGAIGRLPLTNPANDKIVEYQLPAMHSRPMGITLGSDGNLWVTEAGANKLAQFNTDGKLLAEFPVSGAPDDIVSGSDGNLYFTGGGAFEWTAQSHTDGLIGDQFPAWSVAPSTLQKFVVK